MEKDKKKLCRGGRTFDEGTHPGAYVTDYDIDNDVLDDVDSADDEFTQNIRQKGKRANSASPPAADPPVPNQAHVAM